MKFLLGGWIVICALFLVWLHSRSLFNVEDVVAFLSEYFSDTNNRAELYTHEYDQYDLVLDLTNFQDFSRKGWEMKFSDDFSSFEEMSKFSVTSIIGRKQAGKTFCTNRILQKNYFSGASNPTKGISIVRSESRDLILDSAGLFSGRTGLGNRKIVEEFMLEFFFSVSDVMIVLISSAVGSEEKSLIEEVISETRKRSIDQVFFLHNFQSETSIEALEKYMTQHTKFSDKGWIRPDYWGKGKRYSANCTHETCVQYYHKEGEVGKHYVIGNDKEMKEFNEKVFSLFRRVIVSARTVSRRKVNFIKRFKEEASHFCKSRLLRGDGIDMSVKHQVFEYQKGKGVIKPRTKVSKENFDACALGESSEKPNHNIFVRRNRSKIIEMELVIEMPGATRKDVEVSVYRSESNNLFRNIVVVGKKNASRIVSKSEYLEPYGETGISELDYYLEFRMEINIFTSDHDYFKKCFFMEESNGFHKIRLLSRRTCEERELLEQTVEDEHLVSEEAEYSLFGLTWTLCVVSILVFLLGKCFFM